MHLPGPLYESIPTLYIAGGVFSLFFIDLPFSLISACLFVYAGWMVWKMRKDYRRKSRFHENEHML